MTKWQTDETILLDNTSFSKDLFDFRVTEAHTKYDTLATAFTACNGTLLVSLHVEPLAMLNLFTADHTESISSCVFPHFGNYYL